MKATKWLVAAGVTAAMAACQPSQEASEAATDEAAESAGAETPAAPEEAPADEVAEAPEEGSGALAGWVHREAQTEAQVAMVAAGDARRTELARGLLGALTAASAGGDYAGAVEACQLRAPEITTSLQGAAGAYHVRVGRTSERLRNPENTGPDWVQAALDTEDPLGTWLGPDDTVGLLSPIPTGALCLNCHGAADALAPGVAEAVAARYPDDQATGFAEGDVRGWFWVEVTPGG